MSIFTLKIVSFVLMHLLNINHKPIWGSTIIPFARDCFSLKMVRFGSMSRGI